MHTPAEDHHPPRACLGPSLTGLLAALALGLLFLSPPGAAAGAGPDPAWQGFFPPVQEQGEIKITLHPQARATGRVVVVSFGVPFPPGYLQDPAKLAVLDSLGKEMPLATKVLARWLPPTPGAGSIRAVLVQFRDYLSSPVARTYTLRWGRPRKLNEKRLFRARSGWLPVKDGSYPPGAVMEPPVYVTLPPAWLGKCLLKGRILPARPGGPYAWYDQAMGRFFLTAANLSHPPVQQKYRINYADKYEPWLFDRAMTFFITYIRLGGLEHLRQAHRAAQYYASLIGPDGTFRLLTGKYTRDMKYGYQECLALDYWLTGDEKMRETSTRVTKLFDSWDPHYSVGKGFWTERHLAFLLLNATVAYEISGEPRFLAKARDTFDAAWRLQNDPPRGVPRGSGCMLHRGRQHAEKVKGWLCSPWMSVLMVDAMMRYYLVTADDRVPRSIQELADFISRYGLYKVVYNKKQKAPWITPHYLASPQPLKYYHTKQWTDPQHALDVSSIFAAAIYLAGKQGRPQQQYRQVFHQLQATARFDLKRTFNRYGPKFGKPQYPLNPPRKFNWWFRTTASIDWLVGQ